LTLVGLGARRAPRAILSTIPVTGYARQSFLESLDRSDRVALLELGHPHEWPRGTTLVHAGSRADSAIVLTAGLLKIHKTTADGSEVVLGLSGPGDLLGEITAVGHTVRSASATALDAVHGLVIAVRDLRAFLAAHPDATLRLLALTLERLYLADQRRMEFAAADSLARVTSRLVELAERFGQPHAEGPIEVALPINQEDLASWSAASRESTARALRTLRELRLIETQRLRLTVLDLEKLRTHSARL
jgi:CRP/FNR family transcriptional regulator, cyclic AMP receptor protein